MAKKRSVVSHGVAALYREVRAVLEQARASAYLAVNFAIVHALTFPIQDALCLESGTTRKAQRIWSLVRARFVTRRVMNPAGATGAC